MGYAENLGRYWRGRYKTAAGKIETVRDEQTGKPVRFDGKREAKRAADRAEADAAVQSASRPAPENPQITFGDYARSWYDRQDLAASTMQNYRRHIENHLLPTFEDSILREVDAEGVDLWVKSERKAGYAEASIKTQCRSDRASVEVSVVS